MGVKSVLLWALVLSLSATVLCQESEIENVDFLPSVDTNRHESGEMDAEQNAPEPVEPENPEGNIDNGEYGT